jgi:ABC-type maltose transport system permease subunit
LPPVLLAALPVVALYLMAQRQLISAFAMSGVR